MTGITRRSMLAGSIVAGAPVALCAWPASVFARSGVSIPDVPMLLARRTVRGLRDGESIIIERAWKVRFSRQGRGISLTGEQVSANVEAPQKLSALAQIEQNRPTAGMWPILLSGAGMIIAAGQHTRHQDVAAAVREAETILASRAPSETIKAQHDIYLAQLEQASHALIEQLPPDLFFPSGSTKETVRPVALPNGLAGEFRLVYSSAKAPNRQWLGEARRSIMTRIGADERHSSDDWRLRAI